VTCGVALPLGYRVSGDRPTAFGDEHKVPGGDKRYSGISLTRHLPKTNLPVPTRLVTSPPRALFLNRVSTRSGELDDLGAFQGKASSDANCLFK
jgi:hypothetical protein